MLNLRLALQVALSDSDVTALPGNVLTLVVKTPEPATATLSLPALAGLASRRRRH